MKLHTFILLILLGIGLSAHADKFKKREVRGAWLATVYNIDWPSKTGTAPAIRNEQKAEMQGYLDIFEKNNFNSIYFQVRPMADALYKSSYEPSSSFLTGTRGANMGWDPLEWMIEECHKRGMECHAWLNPYRFAKTQAEYDSWTTSKDRSVKNKGMLIQYNGSYIFNPALPETRQRIVDVCREIIEKYDVDGIIFDDYFYPSGMPTSSAAGDYKNYQDYVNEGGKLSMGDWRRKQVNLMVADVYNMIQEVDPSVIFGISPAGVACSDASVAASHGVSPCPKGSDWQYNSIFSDPVAWLEEGTIDYISPQIYWKTNHSTNPFDPITTWWSEVAKKFGRHHYASHSLTYMQSSNTKSDWEEAGQQMQYSRLRTKNNAPGAIWYSACDIDGHKVKGFGEWLLANKYQHPALPPAIDWKDCFPRDKVKNLTLNGNSLSWDEIEGMRYCVYAIPENVTKEDAKSTSYGGIQSLYMIDAIYTNEIEIPAEYSTGYYFAVSVMDRYNNEYEARYTNEVERLAPSAALIWPTQDAVLRPSMHFIWQDAGAENYTVEVSRNKRFTDLIINASEGWSEEEGTFRLKTDEINWAEGTYYWRVASNTPGLETTHSAIQQFTISNDAEQDGTGINGIPSDEFGIQYNDGLLQLTHEVESIRVYSISGMLVAQGTSTDYLDLRCAPGMYIVRIGDAKHQTIKKIMIK